MTRKLRMGMVGGGPGAFIGSIHRMAAALDNEIELVCGAFSSDPERSLHAGRELHLDINRIYGSFREMFRRELELPVQERMEIVSIVTPNHLHFEPAKLALENGFHVVIDKPLCFNIEQAYELKASVENSGKLFCLTYTYTGYPMVKEARHQVLQEKFGSIRKIFVEYPQGWLYENLETSGNKQASWRTDPEKSGPSGAMGDIGTHAFNLAEYISGLKVTNLCADMRSIVDGRRLDDDAAVLLQFDNGASGVLMATQVATGEENDLKIRVYGEKGGLQWSHRDPNSLLVRWPDKPMETWRTGSDYVSSIAKYHSRTPAGHPEGYIEAFANHYRNFALCIRAGMMKEVIRDEWMDYPGIDEGLRGMKFIEKCIDSSRERKWIDF